MTTKPSVLEKLNTQVQRHTGAPIWLLAVVRVVYQVVDWLFDNPLYVAAIAYFGPLKGLLVMTAAAAVLNSIYLIVWQKSRIDWLGVRAIKAAAIEGEEREIIEKLWGKRFRFAPFTWIYRLFIAVPLLVAKLVLWAINRGHATAFVVLSIFQDSFVTTAYFRHDKEGPLDRHDVKIFFWSLVISNVWWTARWSVIIAAALWVWEKFGEALTEVGKLVWGSAEVGMAAVLTAAPPTVTNLFLSL